MKLTFVLSIMPTLAFGMDQMAALSMIETGDNDRMVGRAGEISRYQVLKREWHSVTNTFNYSCPTTAKAVSERLLARRVAAFRKVYHRDPTNFEFYALWNAPGQVLNKRVSRRVAERCQRFANLCDWNQVPMQTASTTPSAAGKLMF